MKRGRKPKPPLQKQSARLHVCCTRREASIIRWAAMNRGTSVSAFLRELGLGR